MTEEDVPIPEIVANYHPVDLDAWVVYDPNLYVQNGRTKEGFVKWKRYLNEEIK